VYKYQASACGSAYQGLPPKCSEITKSTWVYGRACDFWITKGPSVYFEMDRCTMVVVSDGTEVTVMMERARCVDSLRSKR
jgi:hypothetical protein